jgi:hypothetical protein
MAKLREAIQDDNSAGLAPAAKAAWNTIATELVNPTSTVTKPAARVESGNGRGRDRDMGLTWGDWM